MTDLKQILDHKPDGGDASAPTSSGSLLADRLRALSLVTEALGAMVRADCLALAERSTCIDAFEREADGLMSELLVEPSIIRLPARSYRALAAGARDCCANLLLAYRSCIGLAGYEDRGGKLNLRFLRAAGHFLKWQGLARGPAHPALWAWLGAALAQMRADSGQGGAEPRMPETAWHSELTRMLAIAGAGYDRIPIRALPALEVLRRRLLPQCELSMQPGGDWLLALPLDASSAPMRPAAAASDPGPRLYFSVRKALDSASRCEAALAAGITPELLGFPGLERDDLHRALLHLTKCWGTAGAARRSRRHGVDSDVYLVSGQHAIHSALCDGLPQGIVRCRLVDISKHGAGVLVAGHRGGRLEIGDLVAFRPSDGSAWHVGHIRRVWQEAEDELSLGIETLAAHAVRGYLDDGRSGCDVIVCGPLTRRSSVRLIAPSDWSGACETLFLKANQTVRKIRLDGRAALTDDAVLCVCNVL